MIPKHNKHTIDMDFDVSVFIITIDGQSIPVNEYVSTYDGDGLFVMLTNDELNQDFGNDNSICIYRDWFDETKKVKRELKGFINFDVMSDYASCPWQIEYEGIPDTFKLSQDKISLQINSFNYHQIKHILDGYRANQEIMSHVVPLLDGRTLEEYIPAVMVAWHVKIAFGRGLCHGYLPAFGQLLFIAENIGVLNMALQKTGKRTRTFELNRTKHLMEGVWWSATEYDSEYVCILNHGRPNGISKTDAFRVLPLFTI